MLVSLCCSLTLVGVNSVAYMVTHLIVCFAFNCFVSFGCLVFCNGGIVGGLVWCCWFLGCLGIVCYYDLRVLRWCGLIVLVVIICLCGFGFRGFGWIVFFGVRY